MVTAAALLLGSGDLLMKRYDRVIRFVRVRA